MSDETPVAKVTSLSDYRQRKIMRLLQRGVDSPLVEEFCVLDQFDLHIQWLTDDGDQEAVNRFLEENLDLTNQLIALDRL